MNNYKVSIILPVYNGEKTIKATIESLLGQTYSNFELLVCIDGTNDRSEEIVGSFNDPRIRLMKNARNLGLPRTLNRLVSHVSESSEYVAMAEQDDWYFPDRIQAQVEFLDAHAEYGLLSGIAEHWGGDEASSYLFPGLLEQGGQYPVDYKESFLYNYRNLNKFVQTCMMFRKSQYINNGMYFSAHYPNIPTDWDFVLRWCKFSPIYGLHQVLVRKDRRGDRESITKNLNRMVSSGRELLRSYRYECPSIVSEQDYRYAMLGFRIMELAHRSFIKRELGLIWLYIITGRHELVQQRFKVEYARFRSRINSKNDRMPDKN